VTDPAGGNEGSDPDLRHAGTLIMGGRAAEAEVVLQAVVARRPDDSDARFALGVICMNTQRLGDAEGWFRQAIERDPEFAEAHANLGTVLSTVGRLNEAIDSYRHAVAIDPELADAQNRLGDALQGVGRPNAAIAAYRQAAAAVPGSPLGMVAEAKALEGEQRLDEAEAVLRNVIASAPRAQTHDAHLLLGMVLRQLGRFDEAIVHFDEAININPFDVTAYNARVNVTRLSQADRPLVEQMLALLEKGLPDTYRTTLLFALGKACDDLGDHAAAIRHFDAANAIRARAGRLDRPALVRWVDHLITRCTPAFFANRVRWDQPSEVPLLMIGMPRSGTTLVEQILSSHPAITGGGELTYWETCGRRLEGGTASSIGPADLATLAHDYLNVLAAVESTAERVIDKNPWNFQWVGLIHQALPAARFILCRRNPVDVSLSIYFTQFRTSQHFMSDRGDLAFYYRQYARLMAHWQRVIPPDRFTEVDYESLISNREAETRRLIAFSGLPWNDACLHHEINRQPIRTASVWQARQPIYRGSLERWRRYEPWLGELAGLLEDEARPRNREGNSSSGGQ
jgi:tetratricopeptide (TPR) repeat protein